MGFKLVIILIKSLGMCLVKARVCPGMSRTTFYDDEVLFICLISVGLFFLLLIKNWYLLSLFINVIRLSKDSLRRLYYWKWRLR